MWFIAGALIGVGLTALGFGLDKRGVKTRWYDWALAAIGAFLILFTLQNVFGSIAEYEDTAVNMFLLFTGLPGVIIGVVVWQLIRRRNA